MSSSPRSLSRSIDSAQDDVRPLTPDEADRLLARLQLPVKPASHAYLAELQWAFLKASAFHNLELLAGRSPRSVEACIQAALAGRGGPCHVQATAFLALLRALGFRAHLAAATIGQPGDHVVVIVHTELGSFVCDVGNGHPYTQPFPMSGRSECAHLGWRFDSYGRNGGLRLHRTLDDGTTKQVYAVDPTPRWFADFREIIVGHHERAGFGPFLTGIRAVLVRDDRIVTLRDSRLTRYSKAGVAHRRVSDLESASRVLKRVFGFDSSLTRDALANLPQRTWEHESETPPTVMVSVVTTNRHDNLTRLLASLARQVTPAPVEVLIVENSTDADVRRRNRQLPETLRSLHIVLVDGGTYGLPIAEARRAQLRALAARYAEKSDFDVVWLLDDDIELAQLRLNGATLRRTEPRDYFEAVAKLRRDHPEVSVLVGSVCGDPPIRPQAVLATQLLDVAHNLRRFGGMHPNEPYRAPDQSKLFAGTDYYYDHARHGDTHVHTPFTWIGGEGRTVKDAALEYLGRASEIGCGRTPTRPLVASDAHDLRESLLFGANTVFLDLDALFSHSNPSIAVGDLVTRRSDMVGAAYLAGEGGVHFAAFPHPVLHVRQPGAGSPGLASADAVLRDMAEEFFGVMLVRALTERPSPKPSTLQALARSRASRVLVCLDLAQRRVDECFGTIGSVKDGWMGRDPRVNNALDQLLNHLKDIQRAYLGGSDAASRAEWRARAAAVLSNRQLIDRASAYVTTELDDVVARQRTDVEHSLKGGGHGS